MFCPKQGKKNHKMCTFFIVSLNLSWHEGFFLSAAASLNFIPGWIFHVLLLWPITLMCSFEASDALAIEIAFSSVSFSSLSNRSFTCRSGILNTNLSCTMSSTSNEYSQDLTLFFKSVTNWSTVSESFRVFCQNWCPSKTMFFLGLQC